MCSILFHKIYVDSSNIFKMEEITNQTITVSNGRFTIPGAYSEPSQTSKIKVSSIVIAGTSTLSFFKNN